MFKITRGVTKFLRAQLSENSRGRESSEPLQGQEEVHCKCINASRDRHCREALDHSCADRVDSPEGL